LGGQNITLFALTDAELREMRRRTEAGIGSRAGIAPTLSAELSERLLYPRIAAEVVALPKSSALCQNEKSLCRSARVGDQALVNALQLVRIAQ
jgi:hypothetical protein